MTSRVFGWLLVSLGCACLGGCKSDEAEPITRGELPARYAELVCNSLGPCCQQGGFAFNVSVCRTEVASELEQGWSEFESSEVAYDGQAAGDCLSAVDLVCGRATNDEDDIPACTRVFQGKLGIGQPCESTTECKGSSNGSVSCEQGANLTGVCTTITRTDLPHAKAGEACNRSCTAPSSCSNSSIPGNTQPTLPSAACYRSDSLYCSFDGTCKQLVGVGQPCDGFDSCSGSAFCSSQGICSAPRPDGDPCESFGECQSGYCKDTGVCGKRTVDADQCAVGM